MTQIRGVFPLPQTNPQITGTDQVVCLGSGGVYVLPAGNFLLASGPVTDLQWFDPLATIWRPIGTTQGLRFINSDSTNYRLINVSGTVDSITVGTAGSGGTNGIGPVQTGTTIALAASPTGLQAQAYVIIGGSVPAPTLVQGGSGFLVPPIVCCDPPPVGGIQATFVATINAQGAIATVTVVNPGAGYTSIPQFYIIPQPKLYEGMPPWPGAPPVTPPWPAPGLVNVANTWPGTEFQPNIPVNVSQGALIVGNALTGSGTITGINVIYGGGGYTTAPAVTIVGGPLTGGAATAVLDAGTIANDTSYLQWKVN